MAEEAYRLQGWEQMEMRKADMKHELKQSAVRHSERLLAKLGDVMDVPMIAQDAIRREIEYATMDGYRITARNQNRNGEPANEQDIQPMR